MKKHALPDLEREIDDHIARETADNLARGMPVDAARHAARRSFGNAALTVEAARSVWIRCGSISCGRTSVTASGC